MRKEDSIYKTYERHERIYKTDSGWFFTVRQGAAFGPYESKQSAQKHLAGFVSILQSQKPKSNQLYSR
jgi:hypothetical protein